MSIAEQASEVVKVKKHESGVVTDPFTITPDTGYYVTNLLVDGSPVGPLEDYTFLSVSNSHTIGSHRGP